MVLTVAHALQEVLEGFSQLPGLRGGTGTCLGCLGLRGGRRLPHPRLREGRLNLTCVTWGSPPESAICRGEKGGERSRATQALPGPHTWTGSPDQTYGPGWDTRQAAP